MPKGNPKWGKQEQPAADGHQGPTEFERKCAELGLTPDQYLGSAELRMWATLNRGVRYVPEPLLQAWGLASDSF